MSKPHHNKALSDRVLDEAVAGALGFDLQPESAGAVPMGPAERMRWVRELVALVQAPYAMTTAESRARIRAVADRLEGRARTDDLKRAPDP